MREDIEAREPALHRVIGEPGSDVHGFVVVDELIAGRGTGGVRCTESVTLDEVARLAEEMSLKFAFLNLPSGGAKAGIVAKPGQSPAERQQLFYRFGQEIGDLLRNGQYVGGLDMGTGPDDINALLSGAGLEALPMTGASGIDSNYFTALTVFVTVQALLESRGRSLDTATVLLEGVGKVGGHLLRLLSDSGATIVGVSTLSGALFNREGLDVDRLLSARSRFGDDLVDQYPGCTRLPSADLFTQPADVLIPGGGADSINTQNLDSIRAKYVVPVANICASRAIEPELHRRGIEFIPGFVSNAGGVFCWYLGRLSGDARESIIRDGFKARIRRLIEAADRSGHSISATARDIARNNLAAARRLEDGKASARIAALGHKLSPYRLGHIVGSKIFGRRWGRSSNFLVRSYYDARYFS